MRWKFVHDPEGARDWPYRFDKSAYHIHYYVENDEGAKIGYFGKGKNMYYFVYADRNVKFDFSAFGKFGKNKQLPPNTINLGPECCIGVQEIERSFIEPLKSENR